MWHAYIANSHIDPVLGQLAKALNSKPYDNLLQSRLQLAAKVKISAFSQKHINSICTTLNIPLDCIEGIAPCTALQEAMITTSLKTHTAVYFNAFYFELGNKISLARLRQAWERVLENCQILRCKFCLTDDGFAQVALKSYQLPWKTSLVLPDDQVECNKGDWFRLWSQQNINTFQKPFEIGIIRTKSVNVMCVHLFHALYDGNSFPILLRNLSQEYRSDSGIEYGQPFQEVLALGPLCESPGAKDYWLDHLHNAKLSRVPSTIPTPSGRAIEAVLEMSIPAELNPIRKKLNTTYQTLFQACWLLVLRQFAKHDSTVGMVVSGRSANLNTLAQTIGPLFNTIPFFLEFINGEKWSSIIQRCHDFNIASLPYQHTPLRTISSWCNLPKKESLFDTLFVFNQIVDMNYSHDSELWNMVGSISQAHVSQETQQWVSN